MSELQKLLLHIKSLVWCLTKASKSYNLGLIIWSLRERRVLEPLRDTNVGKNLEYIISSLKRPQDMSTLISCLEQLPESSSDARYKDDRFEIGHYLQALQNLDSVPKDTYGVISWLNNYIRGLFYIEGKGLVETKVEPEQVRVIYGTMI
jgi:hypothetical protein